MTPVAALLVGAVSGCGFPGLEPTEELVARGVARFTYTAPERDGWSIIALRSGREGARRIVYVHGTPGAAGGWGNYILDPVEGAESVALDRPGFGRSRPRRAVPSLEDQAAAIEPLLVKRRGEGTVLVGHSLGGPIALRAAADYPDKVGAVVVVAGAVDPDLERVVFIQRVGDFLFMPYLIPRPLRNANREVLPLEDELTQLGALLDRVECPVVVVHGTRDRLVPYDNVAYMRQRLAHNDRVEFITIEEADHFIIWSREDVVREAIRSAMEMMRADAAPPAAAAGPAPAP